MIQITLKLKPSYDIMDLSNEFPSETISNWCNFIIDFYELRGSKPNELKSATRKLLSLRRKRGFGLQKKVMIGNNVAALILRCNHEKRGSFEGIMNRFHAV